MFTLNQHSNYRHHLHFFMRALSICIFSLVVFNTSYAQDPAATPVAITTPRIAMPSSSMSAVSAAEIQKINENMTVLQAQLSELELKAKIAAKQREISTQAGGDALSVFGSKNGNPSVVSVAGLRGNLEAILVFPGGATQRVKVGDAIDDRRVAKVAVNEVVLTDLKGKNVQRLAFGATATTREFIPSTQSSSVMPFPPSVSVPMGR
jgi:type IV pilus biogenesis protein PilP